MRSLLAWSRFLTPKEHYKAILCSLPTPKMFSWLSKIWSLTWGLHNDVCLPTRLQFARLGLAHHSSSWQTHLDYGWGRHYFSSQQKTYRTGPSGPLWGSQLTATTARRLEGMRRRLTHGQVAHTHGPSLLITSPLEDKVPIRLVRADGEVGVLPSFLEVISPPSVSSIQQELQCFGFVAG